MPSSHFGLRWVYGARILPVFPFPFGLREASLQGRSYGGGGTGWGGTWPPQISVPPPHKKNNAYIFFYLPISRVCTYFAPDKYHAYAFLKYALKCLFEMVVPRSPSIYWKKWHFYYVKMPKFSKLARSARSHIKDFHNVSVLSVYLLFILKEILKEIAVLECENAKKNLSSLATLARIFIDFLNE